MASEPNAGDPDTLVLRQIGQQLRETRLARGEDLRDIAAFLRIRPDYLAALEDGDVASTPGGPYAVGFLRSYAEHLAFDGKLLVARLKPGPQARTAPVRPHTRLCRPSRLRAAIVTSALIVGAGTLWMGARTATPQFTRPTVSSPGPDIVPPFARSQVRQDAVADGVGQAPLAMLESADREEALERPNSLAAEGPPVGTVSSARSP